MYSILKSQKRALLHKKNITVTSSLFITNNHILLTFSDTSCSIYFLNLSQSKTQHKIWQQKTSSVVIQSTRLKPGTCVLLCNHLTNIYVIQFKQNYSEHTFDVKMKTMQKSQFASIMNEGQNGLMNSLGCQIRLYGFMNECFVVEYFVFKDRKIVFDCYRYCQPSKLQGDDHHWDLSTLEVDLHINGNYVVDAINVHTGQLAIYKQSQIQDTDWVIRVLSPFTNTHNEYNPQNPQNMQKEVRINLPQDKFSQDSLIMQICPYLDNTYMIITSSKTTSKITAYRMSGLFQDTVGNVPQNNFIFTLIDADQSSFLKQNFHKMLYVNVKDEIFYAITHQHQVVDGDIYFNGLIIGNLRTGKLVEKGYCSLRNISFSPDFRSILDMSYEYDKICPTQTLFHIRLLLSKSSLYMFLIENNEVLQQYSDRFKNTIIQLL